MVLFRRNLRMISTAWSFTHPPSTKPGVSMMLRVKPALAREHWSGLVVSDWNALTTATLSPTRELTVELFPTPPFPMTTTVKLSTFCCRSLPSMLISAVCVATGNCCNPVHSRTCWVAVAAICLVPILSKPYYTPKWVDIRHDGQERCLLSLESTSCDKHTILQPFAGVEENRTPKSQQELSHSLPHEIVHVLQHFLSIQRCPIFYKIASDFTTHHRYSESNQWMVVHDP